MKTTSPAFASFAVDDPAAARRFYGETLGLEVRDSVEPGLLELHVGGEPPVMVYPKPDHKPAGFTVLNFPVASVDETVAELNRAGVQMDRYEIDGAKPDEKGIYRGNGPTIAWFKDPAGNILSVLETGS